jgi:hypothetical protein
MRAWGVACLALLAAQDAEKKIAKSAVGIDVKLAVAEDIPEARLKEMAELFAGFSDDLYVCTEGNFYIKSVVATDRSTEGNVRVSRGNVEKKFIAGGGVTYKMGSPGAYMDVAGNCSVYTFVHEGGHLFFSLPDEYKDKSGGGGCPDCVMVGGNMEGFGPGKWKFCHAANHKAKGNSCWDRVRAKFPNVKYPNPKFSEFEPPKTDVKVINSGS